MARAYRQNEDRRPSPTTRLSPANKATGPVARFIALFRSEVPTGYQDENGFHFGVNTREVTHGTRARR